MKRTLEMLNENRDLSQRVKRQEKLLIEVYKNLVLGNYELAKVLIQYNLYKENEDGR